MGNMRGFLCNKIKLSILWKLPNELRTIVTLSLGPPVSEEINLKAAIQEAPQNAIGTYSKPGGRRWRRRVYWDITL